MHPILLSAPTEVNLPPQADTLHVINATKASVRIQEAVHL